MSLKAKAINSAVSTGTGQLLKFGIRLSALAVLARYLGPEEYGLVALVTAITGILGIFQYAGLSMATVQAPTISQLQSSSMYWLNIGLGAVVFSVICGIGPIAGAISGRPEFIALFPCFGLAVFITSFSAQRGALLQRHMRFRLLAAADVMSHAAAVGTAIALAVAGFGIWSLVAMELSQALVYNLIIAWFHDWRPDFRYSRSEIKPLLRFGISIMASNVIARLAKSLDAIVIGSFLGTFSLGIYNRAQNILNGPLHHLITPMAAVARAAIFRTTGDQERFARGVTSILSLISLGSASIVLTSLSLAQLIVLTLLGRGWMECVPIFMLLMPFAFVEPCSAFLSNVLISKGEASSLLKWRIFNIFIGLAGLLAGLPWGILGVSLSYSLVGVLLRFPLLFLYTSRKSGIPFARLIGSVAPTLLACALGSGIAVYRNVLDPSLDVIESAVTLCAVLSLFGATVMLFPGSRQSVLFVFASLRERLRSFWVPGAFGARIPPAE